MPLKFNTIDYSPLHNEVELEVADETLLAQHVAYLMLGNHLHVQQILASKAGFVPPNNNAAIDLAVTRLKWATDEDRYKRDGWVYQMINWIAINQENIGKKFFVQLPHDAPAQHGIDGVAVILKDDDELDQIIISEDKYTSNPRETIRLMVWPDFKEFEKGTHNNQLVGRVTYMLHHLDPAKLLSTISADIYRNQIRKYRIAITPDRVVNKPLWRRKLFKDYELTVTGNDVQRRNSLTFYQADIRQWMEDFCPQVSAFLLTLKS